MSEAMATVAVPLMSLRFKSLVPLQLLRTGVSLITTTSTRLIHPVTNEKNMILLSALRERVVTPRRSEWLRGYIFLICVWDSQTDVCPLKPSG